MTTTRNKQNNNFLSNKNIFQLETSSAKYSVKDFRNKYNLKNEENINLNHVRKYTPIYSPETLLPDWPSDDEIKVNYSCSKYITNAYSKPKDQNSCNVNMCFASLTIYVTY